MLLAIAVTSAHAQPAPATGDAVAVARELEAKLEYEQALAVVDAEVRAGRSNRDRLAELYLLAGRLAAGLDRARDAETHFAAALALRPLLTLPEGTSPKLTAPFETARARSVPLDVRVIATSDQISVQPVADPLGLVTGIGVRFRRRGAVEADSVRELTSRRFARTPELHILEVRALDRHGNELWSGALAADQVAPAVAPSPHSPAFFARWSTWAVVTGVALSAGGIAAWRFDAAQNQFDRERGTATFTELEAIEARGDRWGLAANISFGVAAASAVVSIICFVRRPGEAAVTVTTGPGAGLGVAGSF